MRRLIIAIVALGSAACAADRQLPPPVISPEMRQLLKVRGALADYAKTTQITIVRDTAGTPVRFRFNATPLRDRESR